LAFVHQVSEAQAAPVFARYGLADAPRVSDPANDLYRAFALRRGTLGQLLNRSIIRRGFEAFRAGHWNGRLAGEGARLGGVFLVRDGRVVRSVRHTTAADRPDYVALASCPVARD
jgi:hypothetical protein